MLNLKEIIKDWDGLTYLDTDQRNDDLLQPLGVLTGNRLLEKLQHVLEDLYNAEWLG